MRKFEVVKDEFRKHPDAIIELPKRGSKGSAGYDIKTPVPITLAPGERKLIMTDIKAYMEPDEVLLLHVRSSIGIKKGIVLSNVTAVIDYDYSFADNDGNIGLALWNTSDKEVFFDAGERICQGIFMNYKVTDDDDSEVERRTGGFGSTGTK